VAATHQAQPVENARYWSSLAELAEFALGDGFGDVELRI
jgi:hypothetical protein